MDHQTFRKNLDAEDDRMRKLGLDPDKVAFQARRVEQEYDRMQENLRLINLKVQSEFFLPMMEGLNKFADWLEAHPEETKKLEEGLVAFAGVVSLKVVPQLLKLTGALTGLSSMKPPAWLLAMLGIEGAKMLAENTVSNVESYKGESSAEFYTRAADPGLADRIYGKRGEQQLHGPHHGLGVHPQPKDDRNLWQRTMPKALGGKDAPEGAEPKPSPIERLKRAARGPQREAEGAPYVPAGPVPGASGYGLTNAYWRGNLDAKGEGGHLAPREMFDYLKANGATDNEAVMLTGAASSESSFNPNAKHDPRNGVFTGHGLFGHNDERLDMRGKSWQQQSLMALNEVRHRSIKGFGNIGYALARARTPEEVTDVEMHYEAPRGFHINNPRAGDNYMGRLNSIRRFSAMANRPAAASTAPASPAAPIGDQAALDAQNRISAGRARTGDSALIGEHRRQQNTPAPKPVDHPDDDRAGRSRASDVPFNYGWRLSPVQYTKGGGANALTDLRKDGALKVEVAKPIPGLEHLDHLKRMQESIAQMHRNGTLIPKVHPNAVVSSSVLNSVRHGDRVHHERHGDTFHVHAKTVDEGMRAAERASARRGGKDGIRNGYSSQQ